MASPLAMGQSKTTENSRSEEMENMEEMDKTEMMQAENEAELPRVEDEREWTEITYESLPEEAQNDITNRYHAPEVLNVWKTMDDGKFSSYVVEVEKPGKRWTVEYDEKGNPLNTIMPE